uniref:Putative conserved secreted protein n=1 Tax=Ixodes scapularis TaxID=6945 RepID=Q4PME1_IXOSC|nr:putative salivary cysteine rich protein [Ixodes scapularis]
MPTECGECPKLTTWLAYGRLWFLLACVHSKDGPMSAFCCEESGSCDLRRLELADGLPPLHSLATKVIWKLHNLLSPRHVHVFVALHLSTCGRVNGNNLSQCHFFMGINDKMMCRGASAKGGNLLQMGHSCRCVFCRNACFYVCPWLYKVTPLPLLLKASLSSSTCLPSCNVCCCSTASLRVASDTCMYIPVKQVWQ